MVDAKLAKQKLLLTQGGEPTLDHDDKKWSTGDWTLPDDDDLTLFSGDSPVGLRLPLNRLPESGISSS